MLAQAAEKLTIRTTEQERLHEKYPDKPTVIAGVHDKHLAAPLGVNPGRSKAEEAARAVGAICASLPRP
jgi:phage/plasmid primase-like uncharacterized protein